MLMATKKTKKNVLRPVSRKLRKLFGPEKPFLGNRYVKTERCIHLELFVRNGTSVYMKNTWIKQLCNHEVSDFATGFQVRKLFERNWSLEAIKVQDSSKGPSTSIDEPEWSSNTPVSSVFFSLTLQRICVCNVLFHRFVVSCRLSLSPGVARVVYEHAWAKISRQFWEEYTNFKWIFRVYWFDGFSLNFAFLGIMARNVDSKNIFYVTSWFTLHVDFDIWKTNPINKSTSAFYASVLLLMTDCVMALSRWLWITSRRRVVPQ